MVEPAAKTCNCKLLLPFDEYTRAGFCLFPITLVFVSIIAATLQHILPQVCRVIVEILVYSCNQLLSLSMT